LIVKPNLPHNHRQRQSRIAPQLCNWKDPWAWILWT
jgi:hypothetical protein